MKKLYILFAIVLVASGAILAQNAQDAEYSVTLAADTSTTILPPRYNPNTYDYLFATNTAVTNGWVLRVRSTKQNYMVLTTGTTSTNAAPTGTAGQVETNGTATLIHCRYIGGRDAAYVTQEADASIWYHTAFTATTNGGEYAYKQGQQYRTDQDGAVSVIATNAVKLNIVDR